MIPYFQFLTIELGPITLQVWGTLVAIGILVGALTSGRFAQRNGLSKDHVYQGGFWVIVAAMIGARLFHVLTYQPSFYFENLLEIFKVWNGGFSVIGGFLGAIAGYWLYTKKYKLNRLEYVNSFIYGLPLGLGIGRIGCFLVHDHPGTMTSFILGVKQAGGGAIHDLGLYLSINGFILAFVFYLLSKKKRPPAFFGQVFLVWYGVVRFFLDFLRVIDTTYLGLTPAQYMSIVMFLGGVFWIIATKKKKALVSA